MHSHLSYSMGDSAPFDEEGVTTALELEFGLLPIDRYHDEMAREGRPINYGASVSWAQARPAVIDGLEPIPSISAFQKAASSKNWSTQLATADQIASMIEFVGNGLRQGGLGIGFNVGYASHSGRKEYYELNKLAAARHVPTFTHVRYISVDEPQSCFDAYEEVVAVAASTGAHMHICHVNSTVLRDAPRILELINSAQQRGVDGHRRRHVPRTELARAARWSQRQRL